MLYRIKRLPSNIYHQVYRRVYLEFASEFTIE